VNDSVAHAEAMTGEAERTTRRYSAFISYTDADRVAVAKLQARLERYRLPPRLAKQLGFDRIKPVFVDRSEMSAAPDLGDALRDALARSDYLIVACSPHTPASHWVGEEIDAFRELRGEANILVALLDGSKAESFHPRLFAEDRDGREPLAADFRKHGDGWRNALLKLIATLVGLDLDDLVHRDERHQRKRAMTLGGLATAIILIVSALSVWAYSSDKAVDRNRIEASQAMTRQLDDLRQQIMAGGTLDMAAAINRNVELFYDEMPETGNLPEVELGRAKLLQAKAQDSFGRGELDAAATDARTAWNISARVLTKEPKDPNAIFVHAQSAYWLGYIAWLRRDTPLAANAWARYADLADRLVKADPANDAYLLEQGYANSNLGVIALREARDPERAEGYFSAAQKAFLEVAKRNPKDQDRIYDLADGESWLADVDLARGDFAAARRHRDEQAKLIAELLESDRQNLAYRNLDVGARIGRARLEAQQGSHRAALQELQAAYEESARLQSVDPNNRGYANRTRAIELFEAQSELEQGRLQALQGALGDCSADWANYSKSELPAYCTILSAHLALKQGQRDKAAQIMADKRLGEWLRLRTLSPTWRLDIPAECAKLGDPKLCSAT